jgi:hypothetical protein
MVRLGTIVLCSAAAAAALLAQSGKKGILHPEMTVASDAGSYAKPMGTLGEKPSDTWTLTTIDAGVNKKPNTGHIRTVTGEIIDMSCYLQLGKHGEKHVSCGKKCLEAGQPVGLLASNGRVYMLMAEEHDPRRDGQTSFQSAAAQHLGHIMEVTGTEASHAGFSAIYVQGFVKK